MRIAIGKRDEKYTLEGMIEMDEGYFTVESRELEEEKEIRGRGAGGKQNVAVMGESTALENSEQERHRNFVDILTQ